VEGDCLAPLANGRDMRRSLIEKMVVL
jgi:hypothetical protein